MCDYIPTVQDFQDMESVNETVLCMPQHREETQCMLKGPQPWKMLGELSFYFSLLRCGCADALASWRGCNPTPPTMCKFANIAEIGQPSSQTSIRYIFLQCKNLSSEESAKLVARKAESCGDATNTTALLAPDPPWSGLSCVNLQAVDCA